VVIFPQVRRFRCLSQVYPKTTFAGQVSGLTSRHGRRTPAVTALLEAVALALGGRASVGLSERLAAAVSRTTLIRLVRAIPDPAVTASLRANRWRLWHNLAEAVERGVSRHRDYLPAAVRVQGRPPPRHARRRRRPCR
jgi:hypothetical protein